MSVANPADVYVGPAYGSPMPEVVHLRSREAVTVTVQAYRLEYNQAGHHNLVPSKTQDEWPLDPFQGLAPFPFQADMIHDRNTNPRPILPFSAFQFFLTEESERLLRSTGTVQCGTMEVDLTPLDFRKRWMQLDIEDRKKYTEKARIDKERYDREIIVYENLRRASLQLNQPNLIPREEPGRVDPPDGSAFSKWLTNDKIIHDPNSSPRKPKKPYSAYNFFVDECQKVGMNWTLLDEEQEKRYAEKARLDKERYDRELMEYNILMQNHLAQQADKRDLENGGDSTSTKKARGQLERAEAGDA